MKWKVNSKSQGRESRLKEKVRENVRESEGENEGEYENISVLENLATTSK